MRINPPFWLYKRTRALELLHFLRLMSAHSQMNREEMDCLRKYARGKKKALEVGTYMGVSGSVIGRELAEDAILYCVDPFRIEPCFRIAMRQLRRRNIFQKVQILRGYSNDKDIIAQIPKELDFILVDGDHSYEGLENDWQIVRSKLVTNGIVCLHDTTIPEEEPYRIFGSVEYFNKIVKNDPDFVLVETAYSMNILRRK